MHSEALNACAHASVANILPAKPSFDCTILYSAISFGLAMTIEIILKQKSCALIRKSKLNAYDNTPFSSNASRPEQGQNCIE